MTADDQDILIGRALRRLAELAAGDAVLRAGLEALARSILGLDSVSLAVAEETAAPTSDAEPEEVAPAPSDPEAAESPAVEPDAEPLSPPRLRSATPVEPMDRASFMKLMEEVARQAEESALGTVAASLRGAVGVTGAPEADTGERVADSFPPDGTPTGGPATTRAERDTVLPGITERTRLKAELARAVADRARTGELIDDGLVHRARSAHCELWALDLAEPEFADLARYADCLEAVSAAAELARLLRDHDPGEHERFAAAVRWLAAAQSALRIAASGLHRAPDADQVAIFDWLKATTKAERIFVDRHMRLDDPLDPAGLADAADPIRAELEVLREQIDREESRVKGLRQVRYHADRIAKGKGSEHDRDKIGDAITRLVADGLPPSNLELRALLFPVFHRLPVPAGRPAAYGRVYADVELNRERRPRASGKQPATRAKAPGEEILRLAPLLRGTELVLIGGSTVAPGLAARSA